MTGYRYNAKFANKVRVFRDDCHIPKAWRTIPEREKRFRGCIQVEFNAISGDPYAAWVYVRDEGKLYIWLPGDPWKTVPCGSSRQVATFLLPPADCIPPEIAGLGRGFGLFSDLVIEAADKLYRTDGITH